MRGIMLIGAAAVLAGVLACGYGVITRETVFANTIMLAGVFGACSGLLLVALALILGELGTIADILQSAPPDEALSELAPAQSAAVADATASPDAPAVSERGARAPAPDEASRQRPPLPSSWRDRGGPASSQLPRPGAGPDENPVNATQDKMPTGRRPVAEAAAITIMQSGEVAGMAYSLYSDGSIEARMAEGVIRFDSIQALRDHLDRRNG